MKDNMKALGYLLMFGLACMTLINVINKNFDGEFLTYLSALCILTVTNSAID